MSYRGGKKLGRTQYSSSLHVDSNNINEQQFWAAVSSITVCFSQFFSRRLLKHFKTNFAMIKNDLYATGLGYLNDEFVAGLTGLIPAHPSWA